MAWKTPNMLNLVNTKVVWLLVCLYGGNNTGVKSVKTTIMAKTFGFTILFCIYIHIIQVVFSSVSQQSQWAFRVCLHLTRSH